MARKKLEDFKDSKGNIDYQAYADYLESAECADDEGYDTFVDTKGNIYERTGDSWKNGHGHQNVFSNWKGRDKNDSLSKGRPWKNPWLLYLEYLLLSDEEQRLINDNMISNNNNVKKLKIK